MNQTQKNLVCRLRALGCPCPWSRGLYADSLFLTIIILDCKEFLSHPALGPGPRQVRAVCSRPATEAGVRGSASLGVLQVLTHRITL